MLANTSGSSSKFIEQEEKFGAHNYAPLPVVLERGEGIYVYDVDGRRYFDMLSAYSALNQGHNHPRIVAAARAQLDRLSLTSRAFHNDRLGPFVERLCRLTGMDMALPMNTGAEAVETAIKAMRQWGYCAKKIPKDQAVILVAEGNFHGRTTTIVGFSSDPGTRANFGPATPGFRVVPYGDAKAVETAITDQTCGFLVEPVQGEAGVRIPPDGYLKQIRSICTRRKILLCLDEIQTGLGRTGKMFCADHEEVHPDIFILGKALSGGLYPVSAITASMDIMGFFKPGTHGSTYGGNPLACAISMAALDVLEEEKLGNRAAEMGAHFLKCLDSLRHLRIKEVRGRGLLTAIEFSEPIAHRFCEILMAHGILAKDTHDTTVRFAPPLIISREQIDEAIAAIQSALKEL